MADDIYVDIKDGDDATGDGTSAATAYKHISRAMTDVASPLTESQTIVLVGDATNPDDYNYQDSTDTLLALTELEIQAGGELVFEPDGWDDYHNLGDLVKPGYYVCMGRCRHATHFLYWVQMPLYCCGMLDKDTPMDIFSKASMGYIWSNLDAIAFNDIIIEGRSMAHEENDRLPCDFRPNYPINWFRVIQGNWSDLTTISIFAVANLPPRRKMTPDAISEIFGPETFKYAVLWSLPKNSEDLQDGFGITDV